MKVISKKDPGLHAYFKIGIIGGIIGMLSLPPVMTAWLIINAFLMVMTAFIFGYWVDPVLWVFLSLIITVFISYIAMIWKIKHPGNFFGSYAEEIRKFYAK